MLFKILLTDKSNFEKSLKNRRLAAIGLLCVGLTGFACYFLLVPDSPLSQYAQGFYLGAASGITAGALILLASHNKEDIRVLSDYVFRIEKGSVSGAEV